jgi:hypothetical protein
MRHAEPGSESKKSRNLRLGSCDIQRAAATSGDANRAGVPIRGSHANLPDVRRTRPVRQAAAVVLKTVAAAVAAVVAVVAVVVVAVVVVAVVVADKAAAVADKAAAVARQAAAVARKTVAAPPRPAQAG